MKIKQAARQQCKIKMSVQGPSGAGKTYGSLLLAKGLIQDLSKVVVIDTENGSSNLYSHLGDYSVLPLETPYTPERYIEAIDTAVKAGFQCIIIDSLSHEWNGTGGLLELHSMMPGNSFTNWSKITPRHNALISKIMESPVHVIATLRSKTEYVINNKDGKNVPEKVGLKAVQREDCEYEFTLAFELQRNHVALVSKDRTGIFKDMYELQLNENLGSIISGWCNAEVKTTEKVNPVEVIKSCKTLEELREVYLKNENWQESYKTLFLAMKGKLMTPTNGSMAH